VSKRKPKRQKRSFSQTVLVAVSALLAVSMLLSLIIVALPKPPDPTPTPLPTWTPRLDPTATPLLPEVSPTSPSQATGVPVGPALPPDTPTITPTAPLTDTPTVLPTDTPSPPATDTPTVPPADTPTLTPTLAATPTSAGEAFIFAVAGDSRDNPQVYRQVLDAVMADGSEFLIHTGDLVNKGTKAQWQKFENLMADFTLPFYPVAGNHDSLGGALDGYLASSGAPAVHYSFDRGAIHFTLADSHNGGITAIERDWLRNDLAATNLPVKMVFLHHPPFDPDGTDHIMAFGNDEFMALMVEQAVDYVFAGHIHAYAQEERDGIIYTITGGGGAPLYSQDHPLAFYHYLRITVVGEDVTIKVVQI
jgi:predicted phosphodiesterase